MHFGQITLATVERWLGDQIEQVEISAVLS